MMATISIAFCRSVDNCHNLAIVSWHWSIWRSGASVALSITCIFFGFVFLRHIIDFLQVVFAFFSFFWHFGSHAVRKRKQLLTWLSNCDGFESRNNRGTGSRQGSRRDSGSDSLADRISDSDVSRRLFWFDLMPLQLILSASCNLCTEKNGIDFKNSLLKLSSLVFGSFQVRDSFYRHLRYVSFINIFIIIFFIFCKWHCILNHCRFVIWPTHTHENTREGGREHTP